jgi:hypothetical protein
VETGDGIATPGSSGAGPGLGGAVAQRGDRRAGEEVTPPARSGPAFPLGVPRAA